ncbi:MAG TPA: hypothetical protein VHB98_22630 [Chloroflexota bacterium]|jgi:hypothetical protein|nr:hypothetical protein [Chloroflexota bacterium]
MKVLRALLATLALTAGVMIAVGQSHHASADTGGGARTGSVTTNDTGGGARI